MTKIKGLIAATYTPFDKAGQLNVDLVPTYATYLKNSGVSGVFVNGTTGEGVSLTMEERMQISEKWVTQKTDNFKVLIHVGHSALPSAQALATHAEEIGADGFGAMPTVFFKPNSLAALVSYNEKIASTAPSLPYYYYHIPSMTGVHFPMIKFLKQAAPRIPNLAGLKLSYTDFMDMKLCLEYDNQKYTILHGVDEILICGLAIGVQGGIGSTYNYLGPLFNKLLQAYEQKELAVANQLQYKAMEIINILIQYGGGVKAGKYFMRQVGVDLGPTRTPIGGLSEAEEKQLKVDLEKVGFSEYVL